MKKITKILINKGALRVSFIAGIFLATLVAASAQPVAVATVNGLKYGGFLTANSSGIYLAQAGETICLVKSESISALVAGHVTQDGMSQALFFANATGIYMMRAQKGHFVPSAGHYLTYGFSTPELIERTNFVVSLTLIEPGSWPGIEYKYPELYFTNATGVYQIYGLLDAEMGVVRATQFAQ